VEREFVTLREEMEGRGEQAAGVTPFEHTMDIEEFRKNGHAMVEWMASYLTSVKQSHYPVLSAVQPGYLREAIPTSAPEGTRYSTT